MKDLKKYDVVIVGAGFGGLAAAWRLTRAGYRVAVVERDDAVGGLGGDFEFADGVRLEKFYHHWFNNDTAILQLIKDLGLEKNIKRLASRVGLYYNKQVWRLSTPLDLLRFGALPFIDRVRLGLMVLRVRMIKNWRPLEKLSIEQWLKPICGARAYDIVWRPLIESKFSIYAKDVNAVWMWKKLTLRGGSRNKKGDEELVYYNGGFGKLARQLAAAVEKNGGDIFLNTAVEKAVIDKGGKTIAALSLKTRNGTKTISGDKYIFTPAMPLVSDMLRDYKNAAFHKQMHAIKHLGNICVVLRLKKSLSSTYWINVNDPGFPFVGVIEHTNFDAPENYGNTPIVFLSRYIATSDKLWKYNNQQYLDYCVSHVKKMFPDFAKDWIVEYNIWREPFAQPIMEKNYSRMIPPQAMPLGNGYLCTMAQIYPEDRGTNYAVREGLALAQNIIAHNN
ncbi:MAG: NAD(P)/FAD-dependent oxidoreductase [Hydrotalea sp.]|nr:NAD(P)/FAD-dependent oxidoreductase [Hydrotalea sp.]